MILPPPTFEKPAWDAFQNALAADIASIRKLSRLHFWCSVFFGVNALYFACRFLAASEYADLVLVAMWAWISWQWMETHLLSRRHLRLVREYQ